MLLLGAPEAEGEARFDEIVAAYGSPQRHYHGLDHIASLLDLAQVHRVLVRDALAVDLAIFFHDVVYDPTRSVNEELSARRVEASLPMLAASPALTGKVASWVRATAHGKVDAASVDPDLAFLLDIDLSILAASSDRYRAYAQAVRREYAHVSDEAFRAGRAGVLRHFLDRDVIYFTPSLQADWEVRARCNLAAELAVLDNDRSPRRGG